MSGRHRTVRAEQFGQRDTGRGGVAEDRPHPAQHLGERAPGPHLAQLGGGHQIGLRVDGGQPQPLGLRQALGLLVGQPQPVRAAQPQHERVDRPLVADGQRVAEVDEYGVGERRHAGPAQPQHDLVQVYAPGDPPGRGPHEAQPVALAPGRSLWVGGRGARTLGGCRDRGGGSGGRHGGVPLPRPGAFLRPGGERLPAFVGGGVLRHAWDSVRPGRLYEAITLWGATVPRQERQ